MSPALSKEQELICLAIVHFCLHDKVRPKQHTCSCHVKTAKQHYLLCSIQICLQKHSQQKALVAFSLCTHCLLYSSQLMQLMLRVQIYKHVIFLKAYYILSLILLYNVRAAQKATHCTALYLRADKQTSIQTSSIAQTLHFCPSFLLRILKRSANMMLKYKCQQT